jgi:hypothetical protein
MDLLLWGHSRGLAARALARRVQLTEREVEAAYGEIERRRVATRYLHAPAIVPDC